MSCRRFYTDDRPIRIPHSAFRIRTLRGLLHEVRHEQEYGHEATAAEPAPPDENQPRRKRQRRPERYRGTLTIRRGQPPMIVMNLGNGAVKA